MNRLIKVALALMLIVVAVGSYTEYKQRDLSVLELDNIEALAQDEDSGLPVSCFNKVIICKSLYTPAVSVPVCNPCGVNLTVVYAGQSSVCYQ